MCLQPQRFYNIWVKTGSNYFSTLPVTILKKGFGGPRLVSSLVRLLRVLFYSDQPNYIILFIV